jgi:hypothetical protein
VFLFKGVDGQAVGQINGSGTRPACIWRADVFGLEKLSGNN